MTGKLSIQKKQNTLKHFLWLLHILAINLAASQAKSNKMEVIFNWVNAK